MCIRDRLRQADLAILVIDVNNPVEADELIADVPVDLQIIKVLNKCDLSNRQPGLSEDGSAIYVSALTGAGLSDLRSLLKQRLGYWPSESGSITARRRHLTTLAVALAAFEDGRARLAEGSGELMADDLLRSQNALAEITGEFSSDDLLGEIFSNFCIGK